MREIFRVIGSFWKAVLPVAVSLVLAGFGAEANPALRQNYGTLGTRVLYPETDLRRATIVAPEELRNAAAELAEKLRATAGSEIRVVEAETAGKELWEENLVLFGIFGTNPMIDRLYERRLTAVDGSFPGAGEFLVHVVADPFGNGKNAVVAGCVDAAGAEAAAREILSRMKNGILPFTISANGEYPAKNLARGAFLRSGQHLQALEKSGKRQEVLLRVLRDIERMGEGYAFTGDVEYGKAVAELLPEFAKAVNAVDETLPASLHGWSPLLHTTWRLLEPSPLFTEEERAEIALCYRRLINWDMQQNYVANFAKRFNEGGIPELRRNKYIFSAFGIYLGKEYFACYFPKLPEIAAWEELTEAMFARAESAMSQDDSTDYFFHVPVTLLRYGAAAGDEKVIREAVRMARLQTMFVDSLGSNTHVGDGGAFGRASALYWGHSALLRAASYYSGDPFYLGVLEKVKNNEAGLNTSDLRDPAFMFTTPMEGEIGPELAEIEVFRLDEPYYRDITNPHSEMHVEKARFGKLNVSFEESFYKMVWREGWETADQYMMLDGVNGAIHEHYDGNTINSLVDKGRSWLIDRSYIERAEDRHNGVEIIKDGKSAAKPYLVALERVADLPETGISRTVSRAYNGADWERTVFWVKGRYFLVRDDIEYLEEGEYLTQNHWQVLGETRVEKNRAVARQKERSFAVVNMNGGSLRMEERRVYAGNLWRDYPYFLAGEEPNAAHLREVKGGMKSAGDRDVFVNLLVASENPEEPEIAVRRLSDDLFLAAWEGRVEAIGVNGIDGEMRIEAEGFVLTEDRISVAGLRKFELGETKITADEPISLEMDVATERFFTADNESFFVFQGTPDFAEKYREAFWRLAGRAEEPFRETPEERPDPGILRGEKWADAAPGLRALVAAEDSAMVFAGGDAGVLEAFDGDGNRVWRRELGTGINDLEILRVQGAETVAVAGADYAVRVFGLDGELLWRRELPVPDNIPESLIGVTNLKEAANGKGGSELIATTAYLEVYRLDAAGEIVSRMSGYHRGVNDLAVISGKGGRENAVVGMEWRGVQVEENGKFRSVSRSPGWNWISVTTLGSAIAGGSSDGWLEWIGETPREGWSIRLGGGVRALATAGNGENGRIFAGTSGFGLYSVSSDGELLWRVSLRDRVNRVLPVDGGRVLAGCSDGTVMAAGANGEKLGEAHIPGGEIRAILEDSETGILLGNAAGTLWRIRLDE